MSPLLEDVRTADDVAAEIARLAMRRRALGDAPRSPYAGKWQPGRGR